MEYKYHPIYKYLFFFVITYAYMKHQSIMEDKILLVNSIVLTIFVMIVDQMFIHNNLTIFQPLSDQYFDDNAQIKITEKQLEQEIKEEKMIEKMKKKKKKSKKELKEEAREKSFEDEMLNIIINLKKILIHHQMILMNIDLVDYQHIAKMMKDIILFMNQL